MQARRQRFCALDLIPPELNIVAASAAAPLAAPESYGSAAVKAPSWQRGGRRLRFQALDLIPAGETIRAASAAAALPAPQPSSSEPAQTPSPSGPSKSKARALHATGGGRPPHANSQKAKSGASKAEVKALCIAIWSTSVLLCGPCTAVSTACCQAALQASFSATLSAARLCLTEDGGCLAGPHTQHRASHSCPWRQQQPATKVTCVKGKGHAASQRQAPHHHCLSRLPHCCCNSTAHAYS